MGKFRVIITKSQTFQGKVEEFSNVYVLDTGTFEGFDDEAAINSIVGLEKAVHSTEVTFVRGESYGINPVTGDNPRFGKPLSGAGTMAAGARIYVECAILVKFELPRKGGLIGIGRRRMLRKWIKPGYLPTNAASDSNSGKVAMGSGAQEFFRTSYAEPLRNNSHGGGSLAAENGDRPSGSAVHPFVEHRQYRAGKKKPVV